ncbi:unnamed protein product, partial [marine sediment metagenome]
MDNLDTGADPSIYFGFREKVNITLTKLFVMFSNLNKSLRKVFDADLCNRVSVPL